jgi:arylsulfatase A-like enzyme
MIGRNALFKGAGTVGSSSADAITNQPGFISLLVLTAWCGVVAGLLEVGTIVIRKQLFDPDHLYKLSRHFVWLTPLSNLCVFLAIGFCGSCLSLIWPGRGRWLVTRTLGAMTLLPSMLVAFPRIYSLAWLVVALGLAMRLVPLIERHRRGFRRSVVTSMPVAFAVVASMGAWLWIGDRVKEARENARALPPPGIPNVLLIVMDTVAAEHLSLHGYGRATSPTLSELAERGIRFDSARAASSWTLPSHASMFTGRWLHELSVGWLTPLDRTHPTLAEFIGGRGYATAGFIANTFYCAADSGLARGFTRYQDYSFPELTVLKTAVLVSRALEGFQTIAYFTEDWLETARLMPYVERVWRALDTDRKGASAVNRELLAWLDARGQQERPFFAFLNYFDAHFPYQLQPGRVHRFGVEPTDNYQRILIQRWWELDKSTLSPEGVAFANDAYDDCIADLDEQIGKLVDELERRGVLGRTWLIIASDHGESFGEHAGIFCHGKSLYESELHVPLLFIPPGGNATPQAVKEPVSLRDLAATIVDLTGQQAGAPFPGTSLARLWKPRAQVVGDQPGIASPALAEVVPNDVLNRDAWGVPKQLPPLGALKDEDWSYIRREGDAGDELFHLRRDPREQHNLAADPSAQLTLKQMRAALDRLTEGPLVSKRFKD